MRHYYRSSHQRYSMKKGVLRNFAKFTGKHLCQSPFLIKLQASYRNQSIDLQIKSIDWFLYEACNFIKKDTLAQMLSCEFCEISKNTFFTEQLWTTASVISTKNTIWAGYAERNIK